MVKVIDRPLEFTLWKSGENYILSVFVDQGVIGGEISILLDPDEAVSLLANMNRLERKAGAVRSNPGLFADETVELDDFA
jgi:hypothetical protein